MMKNEKKLMHGQLVVILGVEDQQVDPVFFDEALILLDVFAQANDACEVEFESLLLELHPARLDVVLGLFEKSPQDLPAGVLGLDGRNPRDRVHITFEGQLVFDVREKQPPSGFGESDSVVDEARITREVIGHGHDGTGLQQRVIRCPHGIRMR